MKKRIFVLLDRDGTIIVEKDHVTHPDQVELIPNAADALIKLKSLGMGIIVITNQSVVGRGCISLSDLEAIHTRMLYLLSDGGEVIDGIYFCPHTVENNCNCRKPKPGLIERASKEHNFDPTLSFVIGDNKADMELGKNIGATTILVRTGYGKQVEKQNIRPDYVVDNLKAALPIIRSAIVQ